MCADTTLRLRRLLAAAVFTLAVLIGAPALGAGSGSTHGPTAPGGDWVEPEYRELGDVMVFGGPGAYVGTVGQTGFDDDNVDLVPGLDFGLNFHLGNNVALTGRASASYNGDNVSVPLLGGARLQFPFGVSTFAFGPEAGVAWATDPDQDESEWTSTPAGAFRVSYEYTFEDGWTLGADASLNTLIGVGTFPRAGLKLGYEF